MGTVYSDLANLPAPDGADPARNGDDQLRALAAALDQLVAHAGDLKATARATAPAGWLMCDGAAVSRTTYAGLFAAVGTTYGAGNGTTTFNVPDLRGRVPVGVDGTAGRIAANDALGQSGGAETHTLTGPQSGVNGNGSTAATIPDKYPNSGISVGPGEGTAFDFSGLTTDFNGAALTARTADEAHNNMQPYQVVSWIVKT